MNGERLLRLLLPVGMLVFILAVWDMTVRFNNIPPYVLPSPGLVLTTLVADRALLFASLMVTLTINFQGFLLAAAAMTASGIVVSARRPMRRSR